MSDDGKRPVVNRLLSYLKRDLASLKEVGADQEFLDTYTRLVEVAGRALSTSSGNGRKADASKQAISSRVRGMSLDQLEEFVGNEDISRASLEVIATDVFSVPKGSLRSYRNKEELLRKVIALIEGRKAHISIERLASRDDR